MSVTKQDPRPVVQVPVPGGNSAQQPVSVSRGNGRATSRLLHRKQAAAHLGVSLSWLDKSRLGGLGPHFIKIGSRVLYDERDLEHFLDKCRHRSTSEF